MKQFLNFSFALILLGLNACSFMSSKTSTTTSSLPKVPEIQIPGGKGDNWRYIGTTDNGQLIIEIDDSSIKTITDQTFSFQERKTVSEISEFTYAINQPHYKYLLSKWLMNCNTKQYLLKEITLFNESAVSMDQINYTDDNAVKWLRFGSGTIAEIEYNYICLNQNRNLGY